MPHTIFTLGYSGRKPQEVLRFVTEHDALLVDVRYSPTSRVPHWNRAALLALTKGHYRHVKEYGNANFNMPGHPIRLADPERAADMLAEVIRWRSVILLCACKRAADCHRSVAAAHLAARTGAHVIHLGETPPPTAVTIDMFE